MDTLPLVTPEQVGLSAARLDRVRTWMHQWVDSGKLAGMVTCVMRKGQLAFAEVYGKADIARNKPMRPDTIFRIYSMTKPLTSTAIMMLYEEGRFQLDDPISKFIPAFASPRVYIGGSRGKMETVPAEREINFRTVSTCWAFTTATMTTSACAADSAGVLARLPPAAAKASRAAALGSTPITLCPCFSRFFAMPRPIEPRPTKATTGVFLSAMGQALMPYLAAQPSPAPVVVLGLYSRPTWPS